MTKKPLLSFVMPVYNGSAFIAESLNSLLVQTLKNIEIVVVDDGSVDSIEPLKKYFTEKDKRIIWYTFEKNQGVGFVRNKGNELAQSDIIAVNDSDDLSYPERAKTIVKYFKNNPDTSIVHSGFVIINGNGCITRAVDVQDFDIEKTKESGYCYICHSTMAYRKKVTDEIKYDIDGFSKLAMDDWHFQVTAYKKGYKIDGINKQLAVYRESMAGIFAKRNEDEAKALKLKYIESIGGL